MKDKYTKEEIQDLAASYSLGLLEKEEKDEFEQLLSKGDATAIKELDEFNNINEHLHYNFDTIKEPPGLKNRVLKDIEVLSKKKSEKSEGFLYVRENEGEWVEVIDGVKVKTLYEDTDRHYSTVLVKMDPGATFPNHVHAEDEECLVIEGDIHMGGETFHPGDYIRAEANSLHEEIFTENGCLLFVQASQNNEMRI